MAHAETLYPGRARERIPMQMLAALGRRLMAASRNRERDVG
jgi:hypothetical protein